MKNWIAVLALLSCTACSSTGPFVWIDQAPPTKNESSGGIQEGDVVHVKLLPPHDYAADEKVRADGKIGLQMIGDVAVRGRKPTEVTNELKDRLAVLFKNPFLVVTVDRAELKVTVLGEVKNGGVYSLSGPSVLHAIGAAGGLSDYADGDRIFVVRRSRAQRIRFRYEDLRNGASKSISFELIAGDIVVVE